MAIYKPLPIFVWGYATALILGNVAGWLFVPLLAIRVVAGLFSIVAFYFHLKWWLPSQCIEQTSEYITGPAGGNLLRRCTIPITRIDKAKSSQRSTIARIYGYTDICSEEKSRIRITSQILGQKAHDTILSSLEIVPMRDHVAIRRALQLLGCGLLLYTLFDQFMRSSS